LKEDAMEMVIPPSSHVRLRRDAIAENEYSGNKLWIVDSRSRNDGAWTPLYCFEDHVCFLPQDFEVMNFFNSVNRTSYFTYRVVCSKYLADDEGDTIIGEVALYENRITRQMRGQRETLRTLRTEAERTQALGQVFGITLSESQCAGIKGMATELGKPNGGLALQPATTP
jgi:arylamine N-acetyltransferase